MTTLDEESDLRGRVGEARGTGPIAVWHRDRLSGAKAPVPTRACGSAGGIGGLGTVDLVRAACRGPAHDDQLATTRDAQTVEDTRPPDDVAAAPVQNDRMPRAPGPFAEEVPAGTRDADRKAGGRAVGRGSSFAVGPGMCTELDFDLRRTAKSAADEAADEPLAVRSSIGARVSVTHTRDSPHIGRSFRVPGHRPPEWWISTRSSSIAVVQSIRR